jgi:methionine-rich copper-binding protein CopC
MSIIAGDTSVRAGVQVGRRRLALVLALALMLGLLGSLFAQTAKAAACPCTIFGTQAPGTAADPDNVPVELGVKFRADQDGFVTGIRFYKATANTGTHTGSLWNASGTRLATVTFSGETASGWQQANFATPVAVTANTTYVASYYAPVGRYASDEGYFSSGSTVNSPLTALQDGSDGGNGVYRYGSGGGFPNSTFNATNYWVDVVFNPSGSDTTKPTVTDRQPAAGSTGVAVGTSASATFSEPVQQSTINFTLTGASNVPATLNYNATTRTATLTPNAPLAASTTYTANLSGAQDSSGNAMDPLTWTFTTGASTSGCPCTIWPSTTSPVETAAADNSAVELGVKFQPSQSGFITGIRFYKGSGNTGTHVGSLWTRTGTKLASVTFAGESQTGWQQATFPSPVAVSAGTTYVASYYAPVGRYADNVSYFANSATTRGPLTALRNGTDGSNGVYKYGASGFPTNSFQSTNYWVDVVYDTSAADTTPPTVVSMAPADQSTGVAVSTPITATFSENVSSTNITVTGPNGTVPATLSYNASSLTATLTPNAPLAASTSYTVSVSGATDAANNTMTPVTWSFTTGAPPPPGLDQGPGGPIAVVTSSANPYSKYLAEILRTEGLNEFTTIDVSTLSASTLASYDVVVLGAVTVDSGQAATLSTWVNGGGNLIALRPSSTLSGLLGISGASGSVSDGYLKVDTSTAPGAGIVSDTIQFHGTADRYNLSGAQSIATLYTNATTATTNPAVTLNSVGSNGGEAAAFTYDLPRSIVAMRQGNQAWAGQERDGQAPIRSDDLFFGGSSPDWVNLSKVAIPQADEQQRLLTNLIQVMNRNKEPLPRFWYFPRGIPAVVVGTGDDHGNGGTPGRFDQLLANSPANCSVANWSCYRYSSYVYPSTPGLTNSAAVSYTNQGFEVGVHETTNCGDFTPASLASNYANDIAAWRRNYPGLPAPVSNRTHCIAFSDWSSQPKTELSNGMRLDGNYYYWPGSWIQDRPGFMSGSGMPMRFADTDGTMIDVYQAVTQMTDESDQTYPFTIDQLLDNATGPLGYYGAFTANMHTDSPTEPQSDALISSAQSHNVPIVSGKQMLTWLDGRNASSFSNISWNGGTLSFKVTGGTGSNGLTGMLPTAGPGGTVLTALSRSGSSVSITTSTIKGLEYASFSAADGSYTATYSAPPAGAMAFSALAVDAGAATSDQSATVSWTTSKVATTEVAIGTSASALSTQVNLADATRKHRIAARHLKPGTKYYYRVTSADLKGRSDSYPAAGQAPATFTTPAVDIKPPKITSSRVTPLPGGIATVRWSTNEPSTAVVQVGTSKSDLKPVAEADDLSTDHALVLTGLDPGKTYFINGMSTDAAGNTGQSGTLQFITPAWGVSEQSAPDFKRGSMSGDVKVDDQDPLGRVTLSGAGSTARSGTFVSGLLDAQAMVVWDRAIWDGTIPAGATASLQVRTGSTSSPDTSWTDWTKVPANGRVSGTSRYLQYRVQISAGAGADAPSLWAIGFSHNGDEPPIQIEGR